MPSNRFPRRKIRRDLLIFFAMNLAIFPAMPALATSGGSSPAPSADSLILRGESSGNSGIPLPADSSAFDRSNSSDASVETIEIPEISDLPDDSANTAEETLFEDTGLNTPQAMTMSASNEAPVYDPGRNSQSAKLKVDSDEHTGALKYSYPIDMPPGRSGMTPELSINYNSQDEELGSIAGHGWDLSIPYIERLGRHGTGKMYDSDYSVFSSKLSGELRPIQLTDGIHGTYGAEVETGDFLVYEFTTQNEWIVTDKKGMKYYFGTDALSRQDDPDDPTRIWKWMIKLIEDANGNYIDYTYYKESGQIYPSSISYTNHAELAGSLQIDFSLEDRADAVKQYNTGFLVHTQKRISRIEAKFNDSWVRRYDLSYSEGNTSARSLLTKISETDGQKTFDTEFGYRDSETGWQSESTLWDLPFGLTEESSAIEGVTVDAGTRVMDINGDALPDLIRSNSHDSASNPEQIYLNNGSQFIEDNEINLPVVLSEGQGSSMYFTLDINGDTFIDILKSQDENPNDSTVEKVTYMGSENGWVQSSDYELPVLCHERFDPLCVFMDLNGDGLVDLVGNGSNYSDRRVYLNTGYGWQRDDSWNPPHSFYKYSHDYAIVDMDSDGLTDIIVLNKFFNDSRDIKAIYRNTGDGWEEYLSENFPPIFLEHHVQSSYIPSGARFVDINNDNIVDVIGGIMESGAYIQNAVRVNTLTDWPSTWSIPRTLMRFPYGGEIGTRLADVNGDGNIDMISSGNNRWINRGQKPDLLKTITHSTGATTEVEYTPTTHYKDDSGNLLNPDLPMIVHTVSNITTDPGFGEEISEDYTYEGGHYYYGGPFDRKFAGFEKVTKTDAVGNKTIQYFHQGNDSNENLGEYDDHKSKIGMMYRQEKFDDSDNLFARTMSKSDRADLGNGRSFVYVSDNLEQQFDGSASHKDKAESYVYDSVNGNLTNKTSWGEVDGQGNGTFTDTGSDKITTEFTYVVGNLSGLPSSKVVKGNDGTKAGETIYYYDNLPLGTANKGNLTKQENWISGSDYASTEMTYNSFGLATSETDPNGNTTNYTYDSYNLYPASVENALNQTTQYEYDYHIGKPAKVTDPNGSIRQTRYDSLGRILEKKATDPDNSSQLLIHEANVYDDNSNPRAIRKTEYLDNSKYIYSYTYIDGLDRTVQIRKLSGLYSAALKFTVRDYIYDELGNLKKESLPYYHVGQGYSTPNTNHQNLFTSYTYDALGRVVTASNALGTTANTYDGRKTTATDALGNSKDLIKDAYGRLSQVNEYNDGETYTTRYSYDPNSNLTNITDALGNVRNFTYDALGRRLTAEDLHAPDDTTFGVYEYSYDKAGNKTRQIDPKNQYIFYIYDKLNRVIVEDLVGAGASEVVYRYDNCSNGIGKLCSAITGDARIDYAYNELGAVQTETKIIDSVNYTTEYKYNRQNQPTLIIYPDNSEVKYEYNFEGLLKKTLQREAGGNFEEIVSNIDYSPLGQIITQENANGTALTNTYNENELYRLVNKKTELTNPDQVNQPGMAIASENIDQDADWIAGSLSGTNAGNGSLVLNPTMGTGDTLLNAESFGDSIGSGASTGWTNSTDDTCDWLKDEGGTPSSATGPSSGQDGDFYAYVETSSGNCYTSGDTAIFEYDLSGPTAGKVDFYYHMYGSTMGELRVDAFDGESWTPIWTLAGDQGNAWSDLQTANFSDGTTKLRFHYTAVGSYRGDAAIDVIEVYEGTALANTESFGDSAGSGATTGWTNSTDDTCDWLKNNNGTPSSNTGPSSGQDGDFYAYVETSSGNCYTSGNTAIFEYDLSGPTAGKVDFYYHMYGSTMGELRVDAFDGASWTPIWTLAGDQGNAWSDLQTVNFSDGTTKLRFHYTAVGSYRGDAAIDVIEVYEGTALANTESFGDSAGSGATTGWTNSTDDTCDWLKDEGGTPSTATGPSSGQDGDYYAYVETSSGACFTSGDTAIFEYSLPRMTAGNIDFYYHMYGSTMGELRVDAFDGESWTPIWTLAGDQGNAWSDLQTANFYDITTKLRFHYTAIGSFRGDAAIDVVKIYEPDSPLGLSGYTNGHWISKPLDVSTILNADSSSISWQESTPGNTSVQVYTGFSSDINIGPNSWDTAVNGSPITGATGDLTGKYLWTKIDLASADSVNTPSVDSINFEVSGVDASEQRKKIETLQDISYTYDAVGNITQIVDASGTDSAKTSDYIYDDLYRLTSATISNSANGGDYARTYSYNAIGNILNKSDQGDYLYENTGYANPHAVTNIAGKPVFYDHNGNITDIRESLGMQWDYKNRMILSDDANGITTYAYDHTGQRVKKTNGTNTTYYINKYYDIENGIIKKHIYSGSEKTASIVDSEIKYHHTDHLSGASVESDSDTLVVEVIDYHPFGSVRIDEKYSGYEEDYKFTGYELDESGLNYAGARYYDSEIGRFTSQDPVYNAVGNDELLEQKTGMSLQKYLANPQALNSYSYSYNNPLLYRDAEGEFAFLAIPIVAYAPIWAPVAITGAAAVSAGVTAWFTGNAIVHTVKGDHQTALQNSNNAMTTLMATEAVFGGIVGVEALVGRVGPTVNNAKKPYSKSRPSYAKNQVEKTWKNAKNTDGKVYDPNTGEELFWTKTKPRNGQWDMGHKRGRSYQKLHNQYMSGKISKEEFLGEYRNPKNYKPQSIYSNRSRKHD